MSENISSNADRYISKSHNSGGLALSESVYLPNTRTGKHSHENAYFCILLEGSYKQAHNRKVRECRPAHTIFHPAEETHSDHFMSEGARIFKCEITPEWLGRGETFKADLPGRDDSNGGSIAWLATRLYREFHDLDNSSAMMLEELTLEMIGELSKKRSSLVSRKPPAWLEQAKDLLHDQFAENLAFSSVARTLGIHPVHFCRVFRQFSGGTVGEYVRKLRVNMASQRLAHTDDALAGIALDCGFSDQSHFSKTFKQLAGLSPAQYRGFFRH